LGTVTVHGLMQYEAVMLVLVLVLKDSLRTKIKSLSLSWSLTKSPGPGPWHSSPCPCPWRKVLVKVLALQFHKQNFALASLWIHQQNYVSGFQISLFYFIYCCALCSMEHSSMTVLYKLPFYTRVNSFPVFFCLQRKALIVSKRV